MLTMTNLVMNNKKTFVISIDSKRFDSKPAQSKLVRGAISNRLALSSSRVEMTLDEIVEHALAGYSWSPVEFKGGRTSNCFVSQQIFVMDIDNNQDPLDFHDRVQELNLGFGFAYPTFSDKPEHRKFRYALYTEYPVTDFDVASQIMRALHVVATGIDKACKDPVHYYFGGKGEVLLPFAERKPLDLENLFFAAKMELVRSASNKARKVKQVDQNLSGLTSRHAPEDLPAIVDNVNIDEELVPELQILQAVKAGYHLPNSTAYPTGERIHREEIKGLVLNLQYIKGGIAWLQKCMEESGNYEDYHWDLVENESAYKGYKPMQLKNFSTYPEDYRFSNILQAAARGEYNGSQQDPRFFDDLRIYSVKGAETKMRDEIAKFKNDPDNKVYVFKCVTGLGKTRELVNLVNDTNGYTFAFKTIKAMKEFCDRASIQTAEKMFGSEGNTYKPNAYVTPEVPNNLPNELKVELAYYQLIGASDAFNKLLKERLKFLRSFFGRLSDLERESLQELEVFMRANQAAYGCTFGNIVTTHTRTLLLNDNKHPFAHNKTLIYDEDPLDSILKVSSVCLEDFNTLQALTKNKQIQAVCKRYITFLSDTDIPASFQEKEDLFSPKEYKELISCISRGAANGKFKTSIAEFFAEGYIYGKMMVDPDDETSSKFGDPNSLYYITKKELPSDRKIAIFSATADETIYRQLLKDRLVFVDLTNVAHKGRLIQDETYSFSKSSLRRTKDQNGVVKNSNALDYALAITEDFASTKKSSVPVLTFANKKIYFAKAHADIHLGNCAGYDELGGEDLVVVGTYHVPSFVHLLYAKALGYKIEQRDFVMTPKRITRNGFHFKMITYQQQHLIDIQCHFIEEQAYQAIGRARTLRRLCEVLVCSNYPIRFYWEGDQNVQACMIDYLPEEEASINEPVEILF